MKETTRIMPPIKSQTTAFLIFLIKLILLFPLSFAMIFLAMWGTGGGHGNFLPVKVIMGPMLLLSLFAKILPHSFLDSLAVLVGVCLYPIYALLLYFVKARMLPAILAVIHIACVTILLFSPDGGPKVTEPYSLTLLAIIVVILVSIRKRSSKAKNASPS